MLLSGVFVLLLLEVVPLSMNSDALFGEEEHVLLEVLYHTSQRKQKGNMGIQ